MFTPSGIREMMQELDRLSEEFQRLDEKVEELYHPKRRQLGMTDERVEAALKECMGGKPWVPFPKKRRPKKQERIVRAWEFTLPGQEKPLVFETEDGCLWELCDVGLGWSYYYEVKPDWKLHEVICRHLPANVNPRPKTARPWDYQFRLARGAILWVKPGSRPKTFKWGIRTEGGPTKH
jgi:hypothetical protein